MMNHRLFLFLLALCGTIPAPVVRAQIADIAAMNTASKRLLVVETTAGYRHESIEIGEETLREMAAHSGHFVLDFVHQPQNKDNLSSALQTLAPANLEKYDGVIFLSTTGDLPIPDRDGFLKWIQSGKAFIGVHSATDTFHSWPEYIEMVGGEFKHHGEQVGVQINVLDANHSATRGLSATWNLAQEEIYLFKNLAPDNHELLALNSHPNEGTPGHFPLAWTRPYGAGRIFYTALGHRDDLWSLDPNRKDRINSVETSAQFRAHLAGGIAWALEKD